MTQDIYLLAKYVAKPVNPKLTAKKGYVLDNNNLHYDEQVVVTRGLKSKDKQYSQVILNLTREEVVKRTNKELTFEKLFEYFFENYADYIDSSVNKLNGVDK
jgi:hypothetical protein